MLRAHSESALSEETLVCPVRMPERPVMARSARSGNREGRRAGASPACEPARADDCTRGERGRRWPPSRPTMAEVPATHCLRRNETIENSVKPNAELRVAPDCAIDVAPVRIDGCALGRTAAPKLRQSCDNLRPPVHRRSTREALCAEEDCVMQPAANLLPTSDLRGHVIVSDAISSVRTAGDQDAGAGAGKRSSSWRCWRRQQFSRSSSAPPIRSSGPS